jgi:pectate lyase
MDTQFKKKHLKIRGSKENNMMNNWRAITKKLLFFSLMLIMASGNFALTAFASSISLKESGGGFESAYIEWSPISNAVSYNTYIKSANASDSTYIQLDNELIRKYSSYWRADAVGLSAGQYVMKAEAILSDGSKESTVSGPITVSANDRSGFAFSGDSKYGSGSGAYQDNGTLKDGAQVIYITSETAKKVTLDVIVNGSGKKQTATGIGEILTLRQKGYDKTPLAIRFIGKVTADDLKGMLNSSGYLQVKGKASYTEMNMTLEGIGEDATAYGWGFLVRNCGNLEIRNLGIMLFPDDGISLDTDNCNIWVHNNDIFYGAAGSDADQAKGDGSADVKGASTYVTIAYNHFWDSGKCSLCGMKDSAEFFVTYHHNWFDHSDSRHPRIRVASVHIYNNYFDGNAKYGVGITNGGSAFVEANYFRNSKYPMMSSLQGTDTLGAGTFSGENGGIIKAFNNRIEGASSLIYANSNAGTTNLNATSFDAYLASTRNETVPSSFKTLVGNTTYNNFDTGKDIGVSESGIHNVNDVKQIVTTSAGRMNQGDFTWKFNDAIDDTSYTLNAPLMSKIKSYTSELVSVGGK